MKIFSPLPATLIERKTLFVGSTTSPPVIKLTFALPSEGASLHGLGFDLGLGDFLRLRFKGTPARAYSPISHPRTIGKFTIAVRVYHDGLVSSKLGSLKVGETAAVTGPLPVPWFTKKRSGSMNVAIVSFGVGITEVVNLLRSELLCAGVTCSILWCLRLKEEKVAMDELLVEWKDDERVKFTYCYTKEEGGKRCDAALVESVFGHLPKDGTSAVLSVGRKASEKECYRWFSAIGLRRRLLRFGLRIGGRKMSPLRLGEGCDL